VLRAEAEHLHRLLLADAVRAVHRLQVHLRVPVAVVEDDDVGSREVDAQAARARREQEAKLLAAVRVERVDHVLAVLARRVAVDAAVLVRPAREAALTFRHICKCAAAAANVSRPKTIHFRRAFTSSMTGM
jgi:hypothetical protein